jgi:ubiquinone/menaquinone biosynthesis C-methylase UbiE/DNA-binding transcriptional ArsR family regulator
MFICFMDWFWPMVQSPSKPLAVAAPPNVLAVPPQPLALPALLAGLRAAGEETRLRILALLSTGELSVSDLTDILGQSQPRISRHLKLLVEAGLIRRAREGAFAFFRLSEGTAAGALGALLAEKIDASDAVVVADRQRLKAVRAQRAEAAQQYFSQMAGEWDKLRSLHASDEAIEAAVAEAIGEGQVGTLLDLGTGTGRMLQVLGARARRCVGVDASHAMLQVARSNLERAGLSRVELRQGDIYALSFGGDAFDAVIVHQVLHFLDDPGRALREAAAVLQPGGALIVVDFASHELEFLRAEHAHRRLGFSDEQIAGWFSEAGVALDLTRQVSAREGDELTVKLWRGKDRRALRASTPTAVREVA